MSQFFRKYNTAGKIRIPIVKAGSSDFAVGADWTPSVGDVKISKDGGNVANIGTLPTALGGTGAALWEFTVSATELQAAEAVVQVVDSATKAVQDQAFSIMTFGNSVAGFVTDFSLANALADVRLWMGSAVNALISGKVDASATVSLNTVVLADVARWLGVTPVTPNIAGVPISDTSYWRGSSVNELISGKVDAAASAGGTVTVSSILSGVITGPAFALSGINSIQNGLASASQLASTLSASVSQWKGSTVNALISGRVDVSVGVSQTTLQAIASSVASAAVAAIQLGLAPSAQTSTIDARLASVIRADVARWLGTTPTTPNIAGKPIVDLTHWRGSAVNELISGQVDASASIGGTVTVSSILAGAVSSIQSGLATATQVASTLTATVSGTVTAVVPSTVNALVSSTVNANITKINNVTVNGAGTAGNEWGP